MVHDEHYETNRRYTGITLKQPYPPILGVHTAIKSSRILSRSLGFGFKVKEVKTKTPAGIIKKINGLREEVGSKAFFLDLPNDVMDFVLNRFQDRDMIFFNFRNRENSFRGRLCSNNLYNTIPSHRMLTDALAQYLLKMGWTKILVLRGSSDRDRLFISRPFGIHKALS